MNFTLKWMLIVARLLQICDGNEEQVFWIFSALIETKLPLDFFQASGIGSKIDVKLVQKLMALRMSDLSRHLGTHIKFEYRRIVANWIGTLFS